MKILVTGGAGFIGSNFVRYWLQNHPDDTVVNFDAVTYAGHIENLRDVENNPNYSFVQGDIASAEDVEKVIDGVDIIVHFAAESHVDRSHLDPLLFVKTNVLGTGVLLQAAKNHKVKRFHHVSTDEVYGHLGPDDPKFTENTPYHPRTPYAASKAGSDHLVRAYFESYGLPVTITNCANNFGPYHDPEKLIPRFITNILEGKKVPLMGKGENIRSWLYVVDHCRAIELVLEKGELGETYVVGGEEKTNYEVTKKVLELLGQSEEMIEYVEHRLGHDFRYAIDDTKLRQLGWTPANTFDEQLEETVQWFNDNEWWWKPLKEGRPIVDRVAQQSYNAK
jgi:dTDP-glucose 4,6-dehydratase